MSTENTERRTNLDRVREMDAKGLVHFIAPNSCPPPYEDAPCPAHQKCHRCWISWLNARAEK